MKKKFVFLIALVVILIDQISKFIVRQGEYVQNTGIGFGLFQGNNWLFIFIVFIIVVGIIYYLNKIEKKYYFPVGLILGGSIGNLIDRIFLGHIVDFIDLKVWPVFNIADSFNVIGVILIIWFSFKK